MKLSFLIINLRDGVTLSYNSNNNSDDNTIAHYIVNTHFQASYGYFSNYIREETKV